MATAKPGFADSMFNLASHRQAALTAEQARIANKENTQRRDIDDLSGFNASLIEGDQQRSIFESAVAEVQSYIAGTGEYEDAEYDPLNFRTQINKITSLYNGFVGHNQGDAASARTSLQEDAYTEGGQEIGRENGMILKSNNTPTSYEEAVESHNNYFEAAMVDGKAQYDENGHPIGYPVINGEVDRSKPASSIFKMDAYANAENFKGENVEEQVPSLYDMSITAQTEIQNKQNIVGPNGLQTLQEVSDLHFDNAINDFNFLDGAIRDRNRANSNSIEITDEEMKAYAAGELDPEKAKMLDSYKAEAKEEWGKLTAYGRTGGGSKSPFTGNTFEHTSSFTTEADANSAGGPNVDIDGNSMELVDPAYNVANLGYGITPIEVPAVGTNNSYSIIGIEQTAQGPEQGGGRFVMIPSEMEMIKMPDGEGGIKMIPYDTATAEQQDYAEIKQPGYSIVDVPNNEMVPIDGPNADPRSREILRNLRDAGIGDADFSRNQAENMGRYEELRLEREQKEIAELELQEEINSTDVGFQESTQVGTGEELDEEISDEERGAAAIVESEAEEAAAIETARLAAEAAKLATNDDSVSDEDTEVAILEAEKAVDKAEEAKANAAEIKAVAIETAAMAEADAANDNLEVATGEAKRATARAKLVAKEIRDKSRPQGIQGLLKNLMEIGPRAAYEAYSTQNELKKQKEAEAKERERLLGIEAGFEAKEAAKLAERERLLGVEEDLTAEIKSIENIPEVKKEAVSSALDSTREVMDKYTDTEDLWNSPYGKPGNAAMILNQSSATYKEELQASIEAYGYPPKSSPHRIMADALLDQAQFGPSKYPIVKPESAKATPSQRFTLGQTAIDIVGAGREGGVNDGGVGWEEGYSPSMQINVPNTANSGVTIAGVDIGSGATGANGKLAILKDYLNATDYAALETLKGLKGSTARKKLKLLQAVSAEYPNGRLTNESMGLTQPQLNEISGRQVEKELEKIYVTIPEEDFGSLPVAVQRTVAGLYFVGRGDASLGRVNTAIDYDKRVAEAKEKAAVSADAGSETAVQDAEQAARLQEIATEKWTKAAQGYMDYYGGKITATTRGGKWLPLFNAYLKKNKLTGKNYPTGQAYTDAVIAWKLDADLIGEGNVTRAERTANAIIEEYGLTAMTPYAER